MRQLPAREGSVAEDAVSMPIRYRPEAIGNSVENIWPTSHRDPSSDALGERAWASRRAEPRYRATRPEKEDGRHSETRKIVFIVRSYISGRANFFHLKTQPMKNGPYGILRRI